MNQYTDFDQFDFKLIISLYRKCENQEYVNHVNLVNVNQEYVENQENINQENQKLVNYGNQEYVENQENVNHGNQENHVNQENVNLTICTVVTVQMVYFIEVQIEGVEVNRRNRIEGQCGADP